MKNIIAKNSILLMFTLVSVGLFSFAQTEKDWFKVELGSEVAVQFPTQPDTTSMTGVQVYKVQKEDAIYMALVINQPLRPDQDPIANASEFYKGFIRSFIKNAKGNFTDSASFTLDGFKGINFSYTVTKEDGSNFTRFNRTILTKHKLYSLSFTPIAHPTESSKAAAQYFFDSIEIKK